MIPLNSLPWPLAAGQPHGVPAHPEADGGVRAAAGSEAEATTSTPAHT